MKLTFEIRMDNSEGVLERILGRMRQRNMSILSMTATCSADQSTLDARITVDSRKTHESGIRQLSKLFDVRELRVYYPETEPHFSNSHNGPFAGDLNEVCLSV